jgi:1-aminocyclopropane-1-carboxylate deaminase/D-cysteine desulfhydrase-like pyridoxal-dependent ACC family enzyme
LAATALLELLPALAQRTGWVSLAELPTAVQLAPAVVQPARSAPGTELWLKRDDRSSSVYGGTKLRLLEHLLGAALRDGADDVYATGAAGSNFTLATALHAPRVGLRPGAICFPQPLTADGERNHRALVAAARVIEVPHWSLLPIASERERLGALTRGQRAVVLSQVRFSADALLGYVSAGLELAQQVAAGLCPPPSIIVLPIGSAATSAGIVAGVSLARKMGLWHAPLPRLDAVRVAAWPLSRRARVLSLAQRALARVAELAGQPTLALPASELLPVSLVTEQLGAGYPHATPAGAAARQLFESAELPILDDTYSAKAAAHVLKLMESREPGAILLWCTKSSTPQNLEPGAAARRPTMNE